MKYLRVVPGKIVRAGLDEMVYHSDKPVRTGTVVDVSHGRTSSNGIVVGELKSKPEFKTKAISKVRRQSLPQELVETLVWMSEYYATPLPLVVAGALPAGLEKKRRLKEVPAASTGRNMSKFTLTPKQRQAAGKILKAKSTVVLHGDTGSGKTLVYRQAAKQTLAKERSVLILVPEIGLTGQAAADFRDLAAQVHVTHSGLTQSQRHQLWQKVAAAKGPIIVIGPRSALMAPLENIGLIIIDEAHENSYKQDVSPRYQAQTVAAYLASKHSAKLVLGSATPRIIDYYMAKEKRSPIIELAKYSDVPPDIELIDKTDKDQFTRSRYLSTTLIESVETTLASGQQALIYLNRRGTATVGLCTNCGWTAVCKRCQNQLTLHKDMARLRCHACGWSQSVPPACPDCGQPDIAYRGAGTKRVEEEVAKLWPSARLARFDTDNLKGQRLVDLYEDLHSGKINIAVGTQMIARGLDLPKLDVVGVVSADSELYLPDFSASERAFQLLYQVIGRAGRLGGGKVVVQAWQTEHPAIRFALKGGYKKFYEYESSNRRQHNYPPFAHLMAMVCSYSSREKARQTALAAKRTLGGKFKLATVGPSPAFYENRGSSFRWQLIAKSKRRDRLLAAAEYFRGKGWQIDIDPVNLLY